MSRDWEESSGHTSKDTWSSAVPFSWRRVRWVVAVIIEQADACRSESGSARDEHGGWKQKAATEISWIERRNKVFIWGNRHGGNVVWRKRKSCAFRRSRRELWHIRRT